MPEFVSVLLCSEQCITNLSCKWPEVLSIIDPDSELLTKVTVI